MALNGTEEERQREAERQLVEKVKLEAKVTGEFNTLFRTMGDDLETFFLASGQIPNAAVYNDDVQGILAPHYRRVTKSFSGSITDFLEENVGNEEDRASALIAQMAAMDPNGERTEEDIILEMALAVAFAILALNARGVTTNTALIGATNQKEMDIAISGAISSAAAADRPVGGREIAKDANDRFTTRALGRSTTIAATTTQQAAEGVKQIELDEFNKVVSPVTMDLINAQKEWNTQGDSKVRSAHIAADSQIVDSGAPFVVKGEQLLFPGDTSLGASAGNVINCRCVSLPIIE